MAAALLPVEQIERLSYNPEFSILLTILPVVPAA
jgi:hypothetical protein